MKDNRNNLKSESETFVLFHKKYLKSAKNCAHIGLTTKLEVCLFFTDITNAVKSKSS